MHIIMWHINGGPVVGKGAVHVSHLPLTTGQNREIIMGMLKILVPKWLKDKISQMHG